ncbi:hypothetical protein GIB67_029683 [Kingdonia uniflora]|uniref:CST complex subunit CTC1 n=1 Tax=Kingdonia uniflora TaxID=39325 RepID=A0A7J7LLZ2_9MAGN|nr:hypothetical protein GIB67_029683 [Kingdonia uniflora]
MEPPKLLSISDLLQQSLPLTGSSSLTPHSSNNTPFQTNSNNPQQQLHLQQRPSASLETQFHPNSYPRILTPLNHPVLIVGTIDFHVNGNCPISKSMSSGCLSFSDGSARVCCAVLDLDDTKIVGKKINVFSWNFIPFSSKCGSFLEIIRWGLPDSTCKLIRCSDVGVYPFASSAPSSEGSCVHGKLGSISPVLVVPCTTQNRKATTSSGENSSGTQNLSGFLVELMVCKCKLVSGEVGNCHSFTSPVTVYFLGLTSLWHPILSKMLRKVICVTGLKKKLVFIGNEDSYLMFVTTEKSVLRMLSTPLEDLGFLRRLAVTGQGECNTYNGIVTGIYMNGMAVELDEKVWLLLTDRFLAPPHPVRVGALISVSNVHFICPKFSWTRTLLLGACFKSTIAVKSFSPQESQSHIRAHTQSLLGNFTDSLVFSARFWLLLTVSCFKKKFAGIFSEKDILGSQRKEGMAQMYASSFLPSCVFQPRHGVLKEFCKHNLFGCGNEPSYSNIKLVVPISNFISHCEASWVTMLLQKQHDYDSSLRTCEGKSYYRLIRQIMSSDDFGVILMGALQISSTSGRLQLTDATASIDVVIPDFSSSCDIGNIYELRYYSIVMEGVPAKVDSLVRRNSEPFSCKEIFCHIRPMTEIKPSAIFVHFFMKDASCLNASLHLPYMNSGDGLKGIQDGLFHILLITHKFPVIQNVQSNSVVSTKSSTFAEATIFPWDLFLRGEHPIQVTVESEEKRNGLSLCNKRPKLVHESRPLTSGIEYIFRVANDGSLGCISNCSRSEKGYCGDHKSCITSSPHDMPCLAIIKSLTGQRSARYGTLCHANCNRIDGVCCNLGAHKMLLEFSSKYFSNYQLLQVGGYYIMKYGNEELLSSVKGIGSVSCKSLVTPQTPLWSLSFFCDEVVSFKNLLQNHLSQIDSILNDAVRAGSSSNKELFFQRFWNQSLEKNSDIKLHLSLNAMNQLKIDIKFLEDRSVKPVNISEDAANTSTCIGTTITAPHPFSGSTESGFRLPQGDLISVHGNVIDVHSMGCDFVDSKAHVRLRGTISKHSYPIGMGPGVNATFHRVLVMGPRELMLTPVSFVAINFVKELVCPEHVGGSSLPRFGSAIFSSESLITVSSNLISEFIPYLETTPMRYRCRVVAIHSLVLEKPNCKFLRQQPMQQSRPTPMNIPFAGFVLDDGSSLCCCWASGQIASMFLRLHEKIPVMTFNNNNREPKTGRPDKIQRSASSYLNKILKKHHRITVRNYGALVDSSCQNLIFSTNSGNSFGDSDEKLLKFVVLNACCGSVLSIVGSLVDSNGFRILEKELGALEMTTHHQMQNIWAREVQYVNPQIEARDLLQQLLGCDGSVLLDDTVTLKGEKNALPNKNSVRGFEVIDNIKAIVEKTCPSTVSCTNILTLAAREAIYLTGGLFWSVALSRRDSLTASESSANEQLPSPFEPLKNITLKFTSKGLSEKDVVLSGAHTVGFAQCFTFKQRLFNFNGSNQPDPTLDTLLLNDLQNRCPNQDSSDNKLAPLDPVTTNKFDNVYYKNLVNNSGVLQSDHALMGDSSGAAMVNNYSKYPYLFSKDFEASMVKLINVGVLIGKDGEIRKNCRVIN